MCFGSWQQSVSLLGHHIPRFAIHFCGSICLILIQHQVDELASYVRSSISFQSWLVTQDLQETGGRISVRPPSDFLYLIGQNLSRGVFIPPHVPVVESDLHC